MTTAEIEHTHWAKRFAFCRSEDTLLATLAAWTVGLGLFTLAGFYIGTIAGHDNHPPEGIRQKDLDPTQLIAALPYAAGGLVIGLALAVWVSAFYVPSKLRELESEHSGHH